MTKSLAGTVALVTGASSGIGEATARGSPPTARRVAARRPAPGPARRPGRRDRPAPAARRSRSRPTSPTAPPAEAAGRAHGRRARPPRHRRQQRRRDAARPDRSTPPIEEWERMVDLNLKGLLYVATPRSRTCSRRADDGPRRVADLVNISSVAGRVARDGSGVYNADQARRRRVQRVAAPGGHRAPRARLAGRAGRRDHRAGRATTGPRCRRQMKAASASIERLEADDIADAIAYIVTRPRHVAINEILVRPTEQVERGVSRRRTGPSVAGTLAAGTLFWAPSGGYRRLLSGGPRDEEDDGAEDEEWLQTQAPPQPRDAPESRGARAPGSGGGRLVPLPLRTQQRLLGLLSRTESPIRV